MFFNNKKHVFVIFSKQTIRTAGSRLYSSSSLSSFNQHCPRPICLFNISDLAFGFVCYLFNCNLIEPCRLLALFVPLSCDLFCFEMRSDFAMTSYMYLPLYALLPFRPPPPYHSDFFLAYVIWRCERFI